MSNEYINGVLAHSKAKRSTRAVLLAIANRVNNAEGISFPGHATIAQDAGISERTVTRAIVQLVEMGELEVLETERQHNYPRYRILLQPTTNAQGRQAVYADAPQGRQIDPRVDIVTPRVDNVSEPTYTRDLKPIETKETKKKIDATHRRPKPKRKSISEKPPAEDTAPQEPGEWREFVGALCWVCHGHQDVKMLTEAQRGALTSEAKTIRAAGFGKDALRTWFVDVWKLDWRWTKNKDRPKPSDVRSSIAVTQAKTPEGFDDASSEGRAEAYQARKTVLTAAEWAEQQSRPNSGPF